MKIIALVIPLLLVGCGREHDIGIRDRKQNEKPSNHEPKKRSHPKLERLFDDALEGLFDSALEGLFHDEPEEPSHSEPYVVRPFEVSPLVPSAFLRAFNGANIPNVVERDDPALSLGLEYNIMTTRCSIRSPAGKTLGDVASSVRESISKDLAASTDLVHPGSIAGNRTSDDSMDPAYFSFRYYSEDIAGHIVVFTRKVSEEHAEVIVAIFECRRMPIHPKLPAD